MFIKKGKNEEAVFGAIQILLQLPKKNSHTSQRVRENNQLPCVKTTHGFETLFAIQPFFHDIRPRRVVLGKSKHHSVYVVELDEAVLRDQKFCAANPNFDPYLSCLYVGMTGLDPEIRFENHKRGHKACRYVQKYGLHLCPQLYEYFNPMSYAEACAKEKSLAEELRAEGYAVWQN